MRIAAFNVENLFDRAKVVNEADGAGHQAVLDALAELNKLFEKLVYSQPDKARMLELIGQHGMLAQDTGPYLMIRKVRGLLISRPRAPKVPVIVAEGRADWVGWCELRTEAVDAVAMVNTARVIRDVAADVLAVVEAENRPVLKRFQTLMAVKLEIAETYRHMMLVDGNDERGIDVGLATREGFPIGRVRSNVDVLMANGQPVFSRDCPEYEVTTPLGARLMVLPNHFKSKYGGNDLVSRVKRLAQATEVAHRYQALREAGEDNIVVLGDLNDTPDSAELQPLLGQTDLADVSTHPGFTEFEFLADNGQRGIGTHGLGNDDSKIDYLLLSPALFARVQRGGLFRMGAWPGSRPVRWATYPELAKPQHAASDHHAIWADIDI